MEQEIQELRRRIDELDRKLAASQGNQPPQAAPAGENAQAAAAAAANSVARTATGRVATATGGIGGAGGAETAAGLAGGAAPSLGYVEADTTGFTIKAANGDFLLKIGADLQVDNRTYTGAASKSMTDTILLRRVRPTFSGTVYKYVDYFFRPDFGQGTTVIYDAYLQLNYIPHLNLRVGKFKPPVVSNGCSRMTTPASLNADFPRSWYRAATSDISSRETFFITGWVTRLASSTEWWTTASATPR